MIHTVQGDIFNAKTEAIVNPVNCVGVMGKGLALAFKQRYPDNYAAYRKACQTHELQIGRIFTYRLKGDGEGKLHYIINFPTKDHWRDASKVSYIEQGLDALARTIEEIPIHSIAIPPLGCGLGGLSWDIVRPLVIKRLESLDCAIYLYDKFHAINRTRPNQKEGINHG